MSSDTQTARNYFHLFSLDENFELDVKALKNHYRELQGKYHPDRYVSCSEQEKLMAVKMSSLLNDAFDVLSNPVKRATYILGLHGVNFQQDRHIDEDILLEQMSLRENIDKLRKQADQHSVVSLESLGDELGLAFQQACKQFADLHRLNDDSSSHLERMKQALSRMLFLDKALHEIDQSLESLE